MTLSAITFFIFIFLIIFGYKKNKIIISLAALVILLLGVLQIFYFLYNDISGHISLFYTTTDSFIRAQEFFLLIGVIGIFFVAFSRGSPSEITSVDFKYKTNPYIIFATLCLVIFSLLFGLEDLNSGRPSFGGIGSVLGFLMALVVFQFTLFKNNLIHIVVGLLGLSTIFIFSRILGINVILAVLTYFFYAKKKKVQLKVMLPIFGVLLFIFLFLGQIKHLIGQGISIGDSLTNTFSSLNWLWEAGEDSNVLNLGIDLNYRIGVELGTSLADCINGNEVDIQNMPYIFYDFFSALIPGFVYRFFNLEFSYSLNSICNIAIVRAPVVDFYRSLGGLGVVLYGIFYWAFLTLINNSILNNKSRIISVFLCILAANSLMLIRGTVGSFVGFSVAALAGTLYFIIFVRKLEPKTNIIA
jgi:hypothetical protein